MNNKHISNKTNKNITASLFKIVVATSLSCISTLAISIPGYAQNGASVSSDWTPVTTTSPKQCLLRITDFLKKNRNIRTNTIKNNNRNTASGQHKDFNAFIKISCDKEGTSVLVEALGPEAMLNAGDLDAALQDTETLLADFGI